MITRRKFLGGLAGLVAAASLGLSYRDSYAQERDTNISPKNGESLNRDESNRDDSDIGFESRELKYDLEDFIEAYNRPNWDLLPDYAKKNTKDRFISYYSQKARKQLYDIYKDTDGFARKNLNSGQYAVYKTFEENCKGFVANEVSERFGLKREYDHESNLKPTPIFKKGIDMEKLKDEYEKFFPWINLDAPQTKGDILMIYLYEKNKGRLNQELVSRVVYNNPYSRKRVTVKD